MSLATGSYSRTFIEFGPGNKCPGTAFRDVFQSKVRWSPFGNRCAGDPANRYATRSRTLVITGTSTRMRSSARDVTRTRALNASALGFMVHASKSPGGSTGSAVFADLRRISIRNPRSIDPPFTIAPLGPRSHARRISGGPRRLFRLSAARFVRIALSCPGASSLDPSTNTITRGSRCHKVASVRTT